MRTPHWTEVLDAAQKLYAAGELDWESALLEAENGARQYSIDLRGKPAAVVIREGRLMVRSGAAREDELVLSIWCSGYPLARLRRPGPLVATE